jgi:WD40 repeat protein
MHIQPEASIVRLFDTNSAVVGTGFLVSEDTVLTCAHVVVAALCLRDYPQETPASEVMLDFPLLAAQQKLPAQAVFWQSPLPNGGGDIALLHLKDALPDGVNAAQMVVTDGDLWGHDFRAFGFPNYHEQGVWASGKLRAREASGWVQIEDVKEAGYRVQPGFSGGAVWDEQLEGVAGMVVAAEEDARIRAAYMIPTTVLVKAAPQLGEQIIPACPYRGLAAFREQDVPYFFGRESFTQQVVEAVRRKSLLAVVGSSGSGKSSVIFAGLIPRLRNEGSWLITSFRPGNDPFRSLAAVLLPLLEPQKSAIERLIESNKLARHLQQGELALQDVIEVIVQRLPGTRLLLVADQFEELYTLCPEQELREGFLEELLTVVRAATAPGALNFNLVLTLRADFVGQALSYRPFADALQYADLKLGPMNSKELQDAIKKPAEKLHVRIEDGLTERILKEVSREPSHLPLLEFGLTLLWAKQRERKLTNAAYEEIGGIEQALAKHAEEIYAGLNEDEQRRAQQIFLQLVRPGEGTEDTRRLATRAEVGEDNWELVARLSSWSARLVVTGRDTTTGEETVEVIHEALIRGWQRLRDWMEEHREFRTWQDRLRSALRQWERSRKDTGALLRGALLVEALKWQKQRADAISPAEQAFIEAGEAYQTREAQRWKELYEEAERQREIALARQLAAQAELTRNQRANQLQRSVLLAIEAWRRAPSLEAYIALRRGLALLPHSIVSVSHEDALRVVTFSFDSKYFVTGSNDGTVRIWDVATGREVRRLIHGGVVLVVAFSPDGKYLVTTCKDEAVRVWETTSYREVTRLSHLHVAIAAFSPDGKYLATATGGVVTSHTEKELPEGPTTRVWEIATGKEVLRLTYESDVTALAFSPDGGYLAMGRFDGAVVIRKLTASYDTILSNLKGVVRALIFSSNGIYLAGSFGIFEIGRDNATVVWEAATGREVARLNQNGLVRAICFSSSGKHLATGSADGTARLWEVVTAREIVRMYHQAEVSIVKFSSNSEYLITGSADGTARMWMPNTGREVARMTHAAGIMDIALSPNGKYLATASLDTTAAVWSMTTGWEVAYVPHERMVSSIAFSPDGKYIATTTVQKMQVWEVATSQEVTSIEGPGVGQAVAFSPGGHYLVTTDPRGGVVVWEVGNGWSKVMSMSHPHVVMAATFSPDEKFLATAGADHMLRLWEVATGDEIARIPHGRDVTDVAFSPDGSYLATATGNIYTNSRSPSGLLPAENHAARLWKVTAGVGHEVAHLLHKNNVMAVAFSPDGKFLATASWDGSAGVLEVAAGNEIVRIPHEQSVVDVVFSPDGKFLATVSRDVQLWEINRWREIARIEGGMRAVEGSIRAVAFSPDNRYLAAAQESACYVWLWQPEDLIVEACRRLTRDLTLEEWQRYLDNEPYRKTCSGLL